MKLRNIFRVLSAGVVLSAIASCHNQEQIFPDYEGGVTAYFAYQYPVRTIVLGESETFSTDLDNQHKFIIYGTMGGAYKGRDIVIDVEIDNSLTQNLYFDTQGMNPVCAMPESYYQIADTQLKYGGSHMGGVEVQLTDEFFADPNALKNTYVIPMVMKNIVKGADQIAAGTPSIEGEQPIRTNPIYWLVSPMDYTLYCVKYINPWHGSWLRRGVDVITGQDEGTVVRHKQYVENDEVMYLTTESLKSVSFPFSTKVSNELTVNADGGKGLEFGQETAGANVWDAQVWYNLSEPLKANVDYTLKFMVKATSAYDGGIWLQDSNNEEGQEYGPLCPYTTEWTEVTTTIKATGSAKNKIVFNFGTFAGKISFDNMSLTEAGSTENLIVNGDFEDETIAVSNWGSWNKYETYGTGVVAKTVNDVVVKEANIILTFDDAGNCVVSSDSEGVTASGTGAYVNDGEKNSWGAKDRDGIYLDYTVDFGQKQYAVRDTLVSRSREVALEEYSPSYLQLAVNNPDRPL